MNRKFALLILLTIGAVLSACDRPEEKQSFFVLANQAENANIFRVGARKISVRFDSASLARYGEQYWQGFITNIFANREAYKLERIDVSPVQDLQIAQAQLGDSRYNYFVSTVDRLQIGTYRLTIFEGANSNSIFLSEEFPITADSAGGIDEEEGGNYPRLSKSKKSLTMG